MEFWIVAGIAAYLMGLSKGGLPMIALLSVPLMSLYMDPTLAAGLLLPVYIVGDIYAIYLFRKAFSLRNLQILIPAAAIGTCIAFSTITRVPIEVTKLAVGGIGLAFIFKTLRDRFAENRSPASSANIPRGLFWGTIAGFTSYITHAGGPPYQVYMLPQRLEKLTYLGTTAILFAAINLMKLPTYILAGQVTWDSTMQSAWIAPLALLGAWSGARISRVLPERIFYIIVETALFLISLKLIYEVLIG